MERIGKYEIVHQLGEGGAGRVYKARDPHMDRFVAIKLLADSIERNELEQLQLEARAAGKLSHRNVISVYGLEIENGQPFLVMELLEGRDLARYCAEASPVSILTAVEIMTQVARGLEHAHKQGIVHRDVSPRNIWIALDGTAKLIDFGIATRAAGSRTTSISARDRLLGTVGYFSPEHLVGAGASYDVRSDIFSYGTVFYELISGTNPFAGEDDRATICNIQLRDPVPLCSVRPECPEALSDIVSKALSKEIYLRYANFRELVTDLNPITSDLHRIAADDLLARANQLLSSNRGDEAASALSRALEFAPDRKDIQQLSARLAAERRGAVLQIGLAELREVINGLVQERRYREALSHLERLRRLSKSEDDANLAAAVRLAIENQEKIVKLVQLAAELEHADRLNEASRTVSLALEIDKDHGEARRLAQVINERRALRLGQELAEARLMLQAGDFIGAENYLTGVLDRNPAAPEVDQLLEYARTEIAEEQRKETVALTRTEAVRYAAFGKYELAFAAVKAALKAYPKDPELLLLEQAADTARKGATSTCACGSLLPVPARFCDRCGRAVA